MNTESPIESDIAEAFAALERVGSELRQREPNRGAACHREFGRASASLLKVALLAGAHETARRFLDRQST
jgi:hypothetical protein